MASLFLSYSRDDLSRVEPLAAALEGCGHRVWWDRHLSGGQEFVDAIEQALESADVVIVCWTANSVHSAWVRDEAGSGRDRGCLVPVTLDGNQARWENPNLLMIAFLPLADDRQTCLVRMFPTREKPLFDTVGK